MQKHTYEPFSMIDEDPVIEEDEGDDAPQEEVVRRQDEYESYIKVSELF